jgi:hypothetical protein
MLKFVLDLHFMNLNEHHDIVVGALSSSEDRGSNPDVETRFSLQVCYMFLRSIEAGIGDVLKYFAAPFPTSVRPF